MAKGFSFEEALQPAAPTELKPFSFEEAIPKVQKAPEDVGFFEAIPASAKRGWESLTGESGVTSGLGLAATSAFGTDAETKAKMEAIKADQNKPEEKPGMTVTDFQRIAKEKGFMAAAAEAPKYIVEQILQSAPQMAGPLAAGAAATPFLTPVGGALVGMGTYAVQQFGNFLVRQAQEKDDPKELEIAKAAITAAGTAPIGYFADRFTLGIGGVGKNAGKEIVAELAARRAAGEIGAAGVAKGVAKRAGVGAVEGVIAEAPTEVLEQAAERWQAGLSLTDDKALNEYKEAFFGAAAAGGGIGGAAKGVQSYAGYRSELGQIEPPPVEPGQAVKPMAPNALQEALDYENTRTIPGTSESSISVPGEEGQTITGTGESTMGGVGGAGDITTGTPPRNEILDNQLTELSAKEAEITQKLKDAKLYIKDVEAVNPNDDRIASAHTFMGQLGAELDAIKQARQELTSQAPEQVLNAPGIPSKPEQMGFSFDEATSDTQRIVPPSSEPSDFALSTPAGIVREAQGIEALPEEPKAKMMLVGDASDPMGPALSFFSNLKPASANPAQSVQFKNTVKNFLDSVAEFVGGKSTKEVSRFKEKGKLTPVPEKGQDVSVRLSGPELAGRMAFLNDFFDGLSIAPKEREALTSALSQQFAGMSAQDQAAALQSLTNVPNLNTVRGITELNNKLTEAIGKYERTRLGEEETAIPFKLSDSIASLDPYVARVVIKAIKDLENKAADDRSPEEQAAYNYFAGPNGWKYSLAMRSAAFDLAVPTNTYSGLTFKGQDETQASLFKKWVEENLPNQEAKRFYATTTAYERMVQKADEAMKIADALKKNGGIGKTYSVSIGRSPSGKTEPIIGAGLRQFMKPSKVEKLDPTKFYPMHPVMQERVTNNDLNGALSLLAKSGGPGTTRQVQYTARYAQKLLSLNLKTSIGVNKQADIAARLLNKNVAPQRRMFLQQIQSFDWGNDFIQKYGLDKPMDDAANIKATADLLEKINNKDITFGEDDVIRPIYGQFTALLKEYRDAVKTLDSSGSYLTSLDYINLNPEAGGLSNGTLLHEVTHAATIYALDPANYASLTKEQQDAVNELKELHEFSKRRYEQLKGFGVKSLSAVDEYGFTDIKEFVAEAMSNENFQEILRKMKFKGEKGSLWDAFARFVAKLFGMTNVMGYTAAHINTILQAPPAFSKEEAVYNARRKSALNGTLPTNPGFMAFNDKVFSGRPEWGMVKSGMADLIENVKDTTRQYYLGGFTLRQLNDMIGHRIPQFKYFIDKVESMLDERNRILNDVKHVNEKWMRFQSNSPEKSKILDKLMIDVTLDDRTTYKDAQGNLYKVNKDPAKGDTGRKEVDAAWKAIGPDGQTIYKEVKKFYEDSLANYINNIVDNKKGQYRTTLDINDPVYAAESVALENNPEVKKVRDYFNKHKVEVYFPIRRFGRFSLQLLEGKRKEFYMFESAAERKAFMRTRIPELEQEIGRPLTAEEIRPRNSIEKLVSDNIKDFTFLKEIKDIIRSGRGETNDVLKQNLEESLDQLYFLTLPDQSVRKMFMPRKGTAGMSTDMLRAFTSSAFHMAYQQSRYKFSRGLHNDIDIARKTVRKKGEEGKVEAEYLTELSKRLGYIMNPTDTGAIPSFLSNVSFLWFMTAPASAVVNMLGVPAVGFPVVAAKFGATKTGAAMLGYAKKFATTGFKDQEGNPAFPSLNNKPGLFTDVQQRAYDKFVSDGLFDITFAHDLVGMAEAPSNMYTGKTHTVMKWLSGAFHGAEKFNREIVGMSTFDLAYEQAKKAGYSDDAAFKKAVATAKDLTYKSMFDYSTLNKPRYFQQPIAKVVLQFKQFSQQMTYLLARSSYEYIGKTYSPEELFDIRNSIKQDHINNKPDLPPLTDKELDAATQQYVKDVKLEARNRLAGTLGMTAVFAGASGLPLWWAVAGVMNAMHAVFGEDDDEWDFENWFKNWCNSTFGGFVGDSISRGVVSQTLGVDVSSRLSLNDMWYRDSRKSTDEVSAVQNMLINLLGPTAGLAINAAEGVKQYNDGHIERALETFSPALIKNILKGGRFLEEGGASTIRGNELIGDLKGSEIFGQALGFTPERLAQRQKANIEMKTAEQSILNRRQSLLDVFFMAVDNGDTDMMDRVLDKIAKFNGTNPGVALKGDNLSRSIKTRYKQKAMAEAMGGMPINKKLIGQLQDMAAYGNPDDTD